MSEAFLDTNWSAPIIKMARLALLGSALGVIDTDEYFTAEPAVPSGCAERRFAGARNAPARIGAAIARTTATPINSLRPRLNVRAGRCDMMLAIRRFKSAPLTPGTQGNGDSTQNSHTFRMLSAYTCRSRPDSTTASSQALSRSSTSRLPSHQTAGWNQNSDSTNMWSVAVRLSRRRTWHNSCATMDSVWASVSCPEIDAGQRRTGRKTPKMPGSIVAAVETIPTLASAGSVCWSCATIAASEPSSSGVAFFAIAEMRYQRATQTASTTSDPMSQTTRSSGK